MLNVSDYVSKKQSVSCVKKQSDKFVVNMDTTMEHYTFGKFNISIHLLTDDQLYFLIMNDVGYFTYEDIITNNDLNDIPVNIFYKIVTRSFEQKPGYNVVFRVGEKKLILNFTVCFEDISTLCYEISIGEKVYTTEQEATLKITEIATTYERKIHTLTKHIEKLQMDNNKLEQRITELENYDIVLGYKDTDYSNKYIVKKNIKTFDFRYFTTQSYKFMTDIFEKLQLLQNIEEMSMDTSIFYMYLFLLNNINNPFGNYDSNVWYSSIYPIFEKFKQTHTLQYNPNAAISFNNALLYLPNITKLEIHYNASYLVPNELKSIPNIRTLLFCGWNNNQIVCFALIKFYCDLEDLVFDNCLNIHELDLIKNYCNNKNIRIYYNITEYNER